MKRINYLLTTILSVFFIFSCGPNAEQRKKEAEKELQRKSDSIELANYKAKEKAIKDSITNAKIAIEALAKAKKDSLLIVEKVKEELKKNTPKYSERNLFGRWFTKFNDPNDGSGIIEVYWKENKTTDIKFTYENGTVYKTSSKWKYKHPYYEEVFTDGTIGKASISWINENKFKLTIKQNQDSENYSGVSRIFERKL
ncbi:MAG: hypothetical protein NWQ17_06370 [Polaribacter sp.]|nr:hypothetical protein [Polaribacter sp.]